LNGKFVKKGFVVVKDEEVAGQPINNKKGEKPRRGAMTKSRSLLMIVLMGGTILLGACSSAPVSKEEPLSEGEMRLVKASLPIIAGGVARIGYAYDVIITFISDGEPKIRRACFFWSNDGPYCYPVKPEGVTYGTPGDFKVALFPPGVGQFKQDCYVEYYQGTKVVRTNTVSYYIDVMMPM